MTVFYGARDLDESPAPRPCWVVARDWITGVLTLLNAVLWPLIGWVLLS